MKRVKAAIEANKEICTLVQLAWKRWLPDQRRSYLRGLYMTEPHDSAVYHEAQFLMELCRHYD